MPMTRVLTPRQERNVVQLMREHGEYTIKQFADGLNVRPKTMYGIARRNGVRRNFPWTEAEDAFLMDNYSERGADACAVVLTNHTKGAIYRRANQLGLHARRGRRLKVIEGGAE